MNTAPHINLNIPQLRALIISRGINIGKARTKTELQDLLNTDIRVLPEKVTPDIRKIYGAVSPPHSPQIPRTYRPIVPNVVPGIRNHPTIPIIGNTFHNQVYIQNKSPERTPIKKTPEKYTVHHDPTLMNLRLALKFSKWEYPIYNTDVYVVNAYEVLFGRPSPEKIANYFYNGKITIRIEEYQNISTNYSLMEYLMTQVSPEFIAHVVILLGFTLLNATIDTYYNFLWYLNTANIQHRITDDEKIYISGLSVNEIINLLGPNYKGPRDHASVLFAAFTGESTSRPDIENIEKYKLVRTYSPENVWVLADKFYNIIDTETKIVSMYPPYIYVALQDNPTVERLFISVDDNNVDKFLLDYQMPLPPFTIYTLKQKVKYFKDQIRRYDEVFTRKTNILPLQIIHRENITKPEIINMLSPYTLKEILETYEPVNLWESLDALLDLLIDFIEILDVTPQWSWRHNFCSNDDTFNVIDMDPHKDMDKNNLADPTISYGIPGNYRCYQISELIAAWNEDEEGIFRFIIPDWTNKTKDNITNKMLDKEFPIESIKQLNKLVDDTPAKWIEEQPVNYILATFYGKILKGLLSLKVLTRTITKLKKEYNNFDENRKYLVKLYLCWVFMFGMWLRFWKGPGTPWPINWSENGGGDMCTSGERDGHIEIQAHVRNVILEGLDADEELKEWIKELPLVDYDLITQKGKMVINGNGPVKNMNSIIEQIIVGRFCLAHGSDFTIRSSYYLISKILGMNTEENINNYINEMLPKLLEIEKQIVSYNLQEMLQNTRTDDDAITKQVFNNTKSVLESRLIQLNKPYRKQNTLKIAVFGKTGHIDQNVNITFDQ